MKKSIIIDFDNTIGHFSQIIYLLNIIEKTYSRKMNQTDINVLLKTYNHLFRPKILEIITFIQDLKERSIIHNLVLYTKNNNEVFVNMVITFIEEHITTNKDKQNNSIFDHVVFSKTKYKELEPLLKLTNISDEIETHICFIDNRNYEYKTDSTIVTIYFIQCDTYKYYYTIDEIAKKMDYNIYGKLNKKIVAKYFKNIYKNKHIPGNIPSKIHEFNSLYIINLLNNFCFLTT